MKQSRLFLAIGIVMMCILVISILTPSSAGAFPDYLGRWFPGIFGKKETGPDPGETLQAPFESEAAEIDRRGTEHNVLGIPHQDTTEKMVKLNMPHRQPEQIGKWVTETVSMALDGNAQNFNQNLIEIEPLFSPAGFNSYKAFLKQANIQAMLESRNLQMTNYVEEAPILRNEGSIGGRYRWLYQVPVTLTFLPSGTTNYADKKPYNEYLMFTIEVGRAPPHNNVVQNIQHNDMDIVIEKWQAARQPKKQ